jgi:hypothetical protein
MSDVNVPIDQNNTDASVQAFLDSMARAVVAGDGDGMAKLWGYPALVIDHEVMSITEPKQVASFFGGAREQYNAMGIVDTRAEIQRLQWLTDRIVAVDVRWPWLDGSGATRKFETSTYTLCRQENGGFVIRVAVLRGVTERGL